MTYLHDVLLSLQILPASLPPAMGDEDQRPKQIAMVLDRTYCIELISHLQQLLMHLQANLFALEYGRTNVSAQK